MSYELKACPCGAPAQERENSPSPEKLIECTECSFAAFITDWQNRADLTSEGVDLRCALIDRDPEGYGKYHKKDNK